MSISCLLAILVFGSSAYSQHFVFSTYGQTSGLTNLNVSALLQDHTGKIWVGTENGVFLADGNRFVKQPAFDKAHLELTRAMHEDAVGRIWVMDNRHLAYWKDGTVWPIDHLDLKLLSAEGVGIVSLPQYPDTLYVLRDGELLRIASADQGRTWQISSALSPELLAQHKELHALTSVTSAGGLIWAGCGQALCRLDVGHGTLQVFGPREGVTPDTWKRMLFTRNGSLWTRGTKYVLKLAPGASRFSQISSLPAGIDLNVQETSLVEDGDGHIVLNLAKGIASTDGVGWQIYTQNSGLPGDEIQTLLSDHSGELWLAPLGHGIMRWHGYGNWEGWTTTEGLRSDIIWSAPRDRLGQVWVVNRAGLDKLNPLSNQVSSQSSTVPFRQLYTAAVDQRQHVWTGDAKGQVLDFDPKSGRTRIAASQLGRVFQMLIDKRQRIWVCSRAGLYFFSSEDAWKVPRKAGSGFPAGYAWAITEGPDGTIWTTTGGGLFRLKNDLWQQIQLPFPGGTAYNFMIAAAPDGTLWSQSKLPSPILHLKVVGDVAKVIEAVDGSILGSDNITFVDTDRRGWIWVGSDNGVQVYNGTRWVQCTQDDGLLWNDTDFHAFFADSDGSVWIGTSAGLSHLRHPERLFSELPPTVDIEETRIGAIEVGNATRNLRFDLRRPTLNVRLINTDYNRRNSIVYRFRLDGLENEWQEIDGGSLRFPALNAGDYTLEVIAYDQRLHLNSSPATLSFTVLEPWWRRIWFRVLEAIAMLFLLLAAWRFSVHILVLRQQELESLVASRTQELEREKSELLTTRSALLETTRRDFLTGLLNRGAIFDKMQFVCDEALRAGTPLAIAMADLDCFKAINDTYGHTFGDAVLRECATRISRAVRPTDWVGRYGGEELLILMPGLQPSDAIQRMEQLRSAIASEPIQYGGTSVTVTCSFGVAWQDSQPTEVEVLVNQADSALYLAKELGRNRVEFALCGDSKDRWSAPIQKPEKHSNNQESLVDTSKSHALCGDS